MNLQKIYDGLPECLRNFLLTLELVQMYKNADDFEIIKIQCVLVSAFIDSM